ncbi:MAG: hypothetical protein P4L35_11250 [Ignavibacteriaceae bacterium]|nr:hypothetical protein [Ignavibacteriaceae bacterium]
MFNMIFFRSGHNYVFGIINVNNLCDDYNNLDSLGLQLVTSLVDQLDGELELKRDNGTEFAIRFTVTEKNNQVSAAAVQKSSE